MHVFSSLVLRNTKDRPCMSLRIRAPPPPPLYKPIKNHSQKNISPGLIVRGPQYYISHILTIL